MAPSRCAQWDAAQARTRSDNTSCRSIIRAIGTCGSGGLEVPGRMVRPGAAHPANPSRRAAGGTVLPEKHMPQLGAQRLTRNENLLSLCRKCASNVRTRRQLISGAGVQPCAKCETHARRTVGSCVRQYSTATEPNLYACTCWVPEGSLAGICWRHQMALEFVCGADSWCKIRCKTKAVVLEGFGTQVWPKNNRKSTRKFPARLPSGTQPKTSAVSGACLFCFREVD